MIDTVFPSPVTLASPPAMFNVLEAVVLSWSVMYEINKVEIFTVSVNDKMTLPISRQKSN